MSAYRHVARREAVEQYRHEQTLWLIAQVNSKDKIDPPKVPALLTD